MTFLRSLYSPVSINSSFRFVVRDAIVDSPVSLPPC